MAGLWKRFPATCLPNWVSAKKEKLLRRVGFSYPRSGGRRFGVLPATGIAHHTHTRGRRVWRRVGWVWWCLRLPLRPSSRCERVPIRGSRFGRRSTSERITHIVRYPGSTVADRWIGSISGYVGLRISKVVWDLTDRESESRLLRNPKP